MLASSIPTKFQIPFANSAPAANSNAIPQASQIGTTIGAASLTDGFPPVCLLPVGAGGVPPWGRDMNGILNQTTAWLRWQAAGNPVKYDSTFQTGISGYPQGAVVQSATNFGGFWFSTADANTTNPDTGGAGWIPFGSNNLIGDARTLTGSATGTTKTAQWTVSEIIAKTAIGGLSFLGSNLTLTFSGTATAGVNAMDVGTLTAGTSGGISSPAGNNFGGPGIGGTAGGVWFSIYAIYNPSTSTWGTLGTLAGSGLIYSGSALPTGYAASTLLWSGACGGTGGASAQINGFFQNDRVVYQVSTQVFAATGTAAATGSWNLFSIANGVPPNARSCGGVIDSEGDGSIVAVCTFPVNQISIFGYQFGVGSQPGDGSTANLPLGGTFWAVPCPNRQLYYQISGGAPQSPNIFVSSYTI
jgi:hypothetical protein